MVGMDWIGLYGFICIGLCWLDCFGLCWVDWMVGLVCLVKLDAIIGCMY